MSCQMRTQPQTEHILAWSTVAEVSTTEDARRNKVECNMLGGHESCRLWNKHANRLESYSGIYARISLASHSGKGSCTP